VVPIRNNMTKDNIIKIWNTYKDELDYKQEQSNLKGMFSKIDSEFLYSLVRHVKPQNIIEFSPYKGFTSMVIMRAATANNIKTLITSYDLIEDSKGLDCEGLVTRRLVVGDVKEQLKKEDLDDCDFLLVDSEHTKLFGAWYSSQLLPRLKPGTIICIHDWAGYVNPSHGRNKYYPTTEVPNAGECCAVKASFIVPGLGSPIINLTDYCFELGLQRTGVEAISSLQVLIRTPSTTIT